MEACRINNYKTIEEWGRYFKSILLITLKSILTTFIISAFIYLLINLSPGSENFLHRSYLNWFINALTFDFGPEREGLRDISEFIFHDLWVSFKYIFLAIIVAFSFVIMLLLFRTSRLINNWILQPFLSLSFIHLIFFYKLVEGTPFIHPDILMVFSLAIGSGVFYDYYLLVSEAHDDILNKDYSLFAMYLGYNQYRFAKKEILINLLTITMSRLPILFSGMIIIEVFTTGAKNSYAGIGSRIWESFYFDPVNYAVAFTATVLCIFIFSFIFFVAEMIKKQTNTRLD